MRIPNESENDTDKDFFLWRCVARNLKSMAAVRIDSSLGREPGVLLASQLGGQLSSGLLAREGEGGGGLGGGWPIEAWSAHSDPLPPAPPGQLGSAVAGATLASRGATGAAPDCVPIY